MINFVYYTPTKMVFGKDTQYEVGKLVKETGAKSVLVHYGSERVVRTGLISTVTKALDEEGIKYVVLGGVVPNPHLSKVREGIELGKANNVDLILAVGGGSVIDSSKAIAYGLGEPDKDVWELYRHERKAKKCLPVATILTIAAAGSEMSNSSVITNEVTGEKRAYDDDIARPVFSILNPEFTVTLPDYQTMSGCTDMMMHTMERYFSTAGNMEITDAIAEALMRQVMKTAKILHKDPTNYEARADAMWAGSLAHNGLTGCGTNSDWATHLLEHELGGMFDVTHGAGLAALWPSWARYVHDNDMDRFVKFALNVMEVEKQPTDEETVEAGIRALEDFYHEIGMPINMKELGIEPTDEQIDKLAESCAKAAGGPLGCAKPLLKEDMVKIYKMAR
ncbi:MAG: iron-containing alcohol dehydrogenase [Erysipelotrichaceae bacterium]|nr:iron-containing alcohol dehydrogenase [Erysipelotrichaceae bacterium]